MSISDKAMAALEKMGLTGTEVRAYVALLHKGTMTAAEVSGAARIPYSKVYNALESLNRKGWVEEQRSRPVLYTAKAPESALEKLKADFQSTWKEKEQIALQELMNVYGKRGEHERPEIWILRGTNEIVSKVKSTVLNCKNELLVALPLPLAMFSEQVAPLLIATKERGVKTEILTSADVPSKALEELGKNAEVRTRRTMFGGGIISDAKEVVLLLGGGEGENSALAIWADHPALASFAREYFDILWNSDETSESQPRLQSR
jgi:sugar-specific transcriptional regulator TrmB